VEEQREAGWSESMTENGDVWVVMPTYNEAPVVRGVVERVRALLPNVVAVDDGSSDGSALEARRGGAHVVIHPINLGAGAALQTGVEYALRQRNAQYFVTLDSDGQHRPEDALRMVTLLRQSSFDIVLGSRFLGSAVGITRSRRLLLRAATVFTRLTSGMDVTDAHNGLRAFNRNFASQLKITMNNMGHASELTSFIARNDFRYTEVPVTIDYTDYSRSKGQHSINALNIAFDFSVHQFFGGSHK
jgi:glycosyltransferase involved in cell wall biosynthesis